VGRERGLAHLHLFLQRQGDEMTEENERPEEFDDPGAGLVIAALAVIAAMIGCGWLFRAACGW
jgi:hypothetical protein